MHGGYSIGTFTSVFVGSRNCDLQVGSFAVNFMRRLEFYKNLTNLNDFTNGGTAVAIVRPSLMRHK